MAHVTMYTTAVCPYCLRAKQLLAQYGVVAEEIRVDKDPAKRQEMMDKSGRRTVPQIFIGDVHVGGSDELAELHRNGKLVAMLSS